MPTTGEIIKELRNEKDMTQKELSELLGVVRTTISSYENDAITPDIDKLIKLTKIFDVSLDYLMRLTRSRVSLKYLDGEYCKTDGKPVLAGDVFKRIVGLTPKHRLMLIEYLNFLELKK